ncbi:MAG: hypothetical protein CMJ89_04580 [Planctomycetes bacterium]|jgi:hypothetical protein|nr:hypothetical protein [Planctomycetota bacterium]
MLLTSGLLGVALASGGMVHPPCQEDGGRHAGQGFTSDSTRMTRPDPDGVPTEVHIGIYTLDIEAIDDLTQAFTVDMFVILEWKDSRLALKDPNASLEHRQLGIEELWTPDLMLYNDRSTVKRLPKVFTVSPNGGVKYRQRFYGTFSAPLDMREFPLDHQVLPISVVSLSYGPDEVKLAVDGIGRDPDFTIPGWEIGPPQARLSTLLVETDGGPEGVELARVDYEYPAQRHGLYYGLKVIAPLTLIMCMALAAFWIGWTESGVQVRVATTACLTLIAFLFGLGQYLPPISYLTRIDYFVFNSLALVFLAFLKVMLCLRLKNLGKEEAVARIDAVTRWLFLACFAAIQVSFWV